MTLHIGEKIKEVAKSKRIGSTEFGQLINTSKQNIYGIYSRKSIDSELLPKISDALDHDFFQYYLTQEQDGLVNDEVSNESVAALKEQLAELKKELGFLKNENNYLKEIMELLKKQQKN
ncbi:MAG: hypothetical protein ACI837_002174 [Crocinitomicaceae bacterium]|jgi:hypothetical protein